MHQPERLKPADYIRRGLSHLLQFARGLAYLHGLHVIHGDVKCVNVLLDKSGRALLADFGMSRICMDVSAYTSGHGLRGGSWTHIAPELIVAASGRTTFEGDVYAFGIAGYEMISGGYEAYYDPARKEDFGTSAYQNEIRDEVISKGRRPTRPSNLSNGLIGLWKLLERCWAQNPAERPGMPEVVANLEDLVEQAGGFLALA